MKDGSADASQDSRKSSGSTKSPPLLKTAQCGQSHYATMPHTL